MLLVKLLVYPLLVCPLLGYAPPAPRARRRGAAPRMAIDAPLSIPVAIKGGDRLAGVRLSDEELRALADAATSSTVALPVLRQLLRSWRYWLHGFVPETAEAARLHLLPRGQQCVVKSIFRIFSNSATARQGMIVLQFTPGNESRQRKLVPNTSCIHDHLGA